MIFHFKIAQFPIQILFECQLLPVSTNFFASFQTRFKLTNAFILILLVYCAMNMDIMLARLVLHDLRDLILCCTTCVVISHLTRMNQKSTNLKLLN